MGRETYRRMLQGMSPGGSPEWNVYVVRCSDGSLYTGVAKDVSSRIGKHNAGRGAAYTRTRGPVTLVHHEAGHTRSSALIREARIKSMPRARKLALAGLRPAGNRSSKPKRGGPS